MNAKELEAIRDRIAPILDRGEASLLVGAGFSVTNTTPLGRLPNGEGLRDLILEKCGKVAGPKTTLKDAYQLGLREIEKFEEFLASCFLVDTALPWQQKLFSYAWNRIYSTNIDNVLTVAHETARKKRALGGDFTFLNYCDPSTASETIGVIPVVSMHGTCEKLKEGFIFSSLEYAKAAIKVLDWHGDLAARMLTGGLVVVGSQLDESDFEAKLEVRRQTYGSKDAPANWIVMPNPDSIKADNYRAAGYEVIDATAEQFFNYLYDVLKPRNIGAIVLATVPMVKKAAAGVRAMTWFKNAFRPVLFEIEQANEQTGILRHYITGAHPDWFYIVNSAHAQTSRINDLVAEIGAMLQSNASGIGVLNVVGPSGSGKTTAVRSAISSIVKSYQYIYEFDGNGEIDAELLRETIDGFTEKAIFVFYSSAEYYYAIGYVFDHFKNKSRPYCLFILEDRLSDYRRNVRQIPARSNPKTFALSDLNIDDARLIANKIDDSGLVFQNFSNQSLEKRAQILVDKERGFGGDLLSALFSLTTHENFEQKIFQEYHSERTAVSQRILEIVTIVNSLGFQVPINYLSGFLNLRVDLVAKSLDEDLAGVVVSAQKFSVFRCRHRIIADYYFRSCVAGNGSVDVVVDILGFLSRQFAISDIKLHPLPYRIYKDIISYEFLYEKYFPEDSREQDVLRTYHEAQRFFGKDGIFWLHFGRYYRKQDKLDEAIDCFRTGLEFYDSFQTRHSLGVTLMEKYLIEGCDDVSLYDSALAILEQERISRGDKDAYPVTGLVDLLLRVVDVNPENISAEEKLKECINYGLRYFREDERFMRSFRKYTQRWG